MAKLSMMDGMNVNPFFQMNTGEKEKGARSQMSPLNTGHWTGVRRWGKFHIHIWNCK